MMTVPLAAISANVQPVLVEPVVESTHGRCIFDSSLHIPAQIIANHGTVNDVFVLLVVDVFFNAVSHSLPSGLSS